MKKTLIALSLAALSTAAMADVTLYGQIKAGVQTGRVKTTVDGETTKGHTYTQLNDFGSRIGFKGHEDLGNGLNAIWKVEQKTSVAGNSTGWGNRLAYIGLETTAGTIRAGRIGTQLDDMDKVDAWEYDSDSAVGNALGLGTFTRTGSKILSVRYDSPIFAGFSANVQFTPRDNEVTAVRGIGNTNGRDNVAGDTSAYYAGLNYENSGFFAQYGFGLKKTASVVYGKDKSGQAHRVEAGYDANNLFVGVGYQYTNGWDSLDSYYSAISGGTDTNGDSYSAAADTNPINLRTHELAATASYQFGNVTPRVSYAHGFKAKPKNAGAHGLTSDDVNDIKNATSYNQVVLGADYSFSKRTTAFAQAGWLKAGKGDYKHEATGGLVGLKHKF